MQVTQCYAQQAPSSFAGGDWGTLISFLLGTRHSDHCKAIHTLARAFPKLRHPCHVAQLLNHRLPILNKVTDFKCNLGLIFLDLLCKWTRCSITSQASRLTPHASCTLPFCLMAHGSRKPSTTHCLLIFLIFPPCLLSPPSPFSPSSFLSHLPAVMRLYHVLWS